MNTESTDKAAWISRAGGRKYNEDALHFEERGGIAFAALADGLGGHRGGETASKTAIEAACSAFWEKGSISADALESCARRAKEALVEVQQADPSFSRMKTTLVLWASDGNQAVWGHVGDSRLYHFRQGRLQSRTKDHSLPQKLADIGEIAEEAIRHHEDRNRLTAVLDGSTPLRWAAGSTRLQADGEDAFLLCSDGFWELVTEVDMCTTLAAAPSPQAWLKVMEEKLLTQAPTDHDNYTALAVFSG